MKIHELLKRNASLFPTKIFLYTEGESITYGKAWEEVQRVSSALDSMGLGIGDRVEFFATDSIPYVLGMLSVFARGAIAAFVDIADGARLKEYHNMIEPKIVFCDSKSLPTFSNAAAGSSKVIMLDGGSQQQQVSWNDLIKSADYEPKEFDFTDDTSCHLAFTSGTTYLPKPVVLAHEPTVRATRVIVERFGLLDDDITLSVTPYSNSHVLVYGLLPQMHRRSTTGFLLGAWDPNSGPSRTWKLIKKKRVTLLSGNTYRLRTIADYAIRRKLARGKLRKVVSGGGPAYQSLRTKWQKLGVSLIETYGMSECGGAVSETAQYAIKQGRMVYKPLVPSSGIIMADKEVRIVDEGDHELPRGVPGQIIFRGGYMVGYWRMPKETSEKTAGGWLHTGDIGFLDEYDSLYWLARATDLIKNKEGKTLYPRITEEALYLHPCVAQTSVVAVDEGSTQAPYAFVVPYHNNKNKISEKELIRFITRKLPAEYVPSRIIIRENLPMTASGKIEKKSLKGLIHD
jgi:long-chain acyl-CoA synthetase